MPTHYPGTCDERRALDTFIKLMRAAESVAQRAFVGVAAAGLTEGQFGVLEALHHLGPLRLSDLATKHLRSPNNLTVIVDNLERDGLVRRVRDDKDRRVTHVHLTEAGAEKIAALFPCHVVSIQRQLAVLTAEEQETLSTLLKKLGKGS